MPSAAKMCSEIFTWELVQKRYFDPTFGGALVSGQRNVFQTTADLTGYAFIVGPRSYSPDRFHRPRQSRSTDSASSGRPTTILYYHGISDSAISADYRWKKYFVSAGHNEVHNDPLLSPNANQFRFGGGIGDANRRGWNGKVDAVYDYRKGVMQYSTTLVTYNTDCCGISVQYRVYNIGAPTAASCVYRSPSPTSGRSVPSASRTACSSSPPEFSPRDPPPEPPPWSSGSPAGVRAGSAALSATT